METTVEKFIQNIKGKKVIGSKIRTKLEDYTAGMIELILDDGTIFLLSLGDEDIDVNALA